MQLVQTLIPADHPNVGKLLSLFTGLTTLIGNGEISQSMSKMRLIANNAAGLWEEPILSQPALHYRIYGYIQRFATLISQQIYCRDKPTPRSLLAFSLHAYLWWLLVTYLSAHLGGVSTNSKRKASCRNHTQVHTNLNTHTHSHTH